jgi:hypothetical protein
LVEIDLEVCDASPMKARRLVVGLAVLLTVAAPLVAAAQRRGGFGFGSRFRPMENLPYDGRFTFVRVQYERYGGWAADYPTMERNLTTILHEITSLRPHLMGSNIHTFDDPQLLKYPIAYLSEPGYWYPNEAEVLGLRDYLLKGGFLIADDFHFPNEWNVFETAIRRVLPTARIDRLDRSHPIFNSFFQIESLKVPYPGRLGEQGLMGEFLGIHEDNNPRRRLMVSINYNIDIGDYVEWSGENLYNPLATNEAYKFMINYIVYGMTH